eukprot:6565621-Pyramimonas_sp.AAC.1
MGGYTCRWACEIAWEAGRAAVSTHPKLDDQGSGSTHDYCVWGHQDISGNQVMRVRFCQPGLKDDLSNTLPSGSYLQVATTCTRPPTNLRRRACKTAGGPAQPTEHVLDWYRQGAQKVEWRNKTLAIMAARLIDPMDLRRTQRNHTSAAHLRIHTRVDKGVRTYVQSPKNGPELGH